MKAIATALDGVLILEPRVFEDARGCFFESWNARTFAELTGVQAEFVQDNHSVSHRGVLRGLHYQLPPMAQGKLVRVVQGAVFDVVVDLRRASPRFGRWHGVELSAENRRQLWIPPGFAHGFLSLADASVVLYKTTAGYSPAHERCLRWDDPRLAIAWPLAGVPLLSPRDAQGLALADAEVFP
ncbi:dTDP-4-dehydrorhamnose 3,5-epimerase [Pseudomonas oryzae]|uniref:dTDP-4-dehydrorhamnose 3,5-epimerase n=1 Tax=Pseudomonas oryzae TaxID=1392877 RepID=A0A1H1YP12_9PSED|nr:dTDP-4-dehydrorhamnose 3,5-epimerase [Pseudomonas oryzae]SDT23218.1 dTDP-4-dehydrorhamnose 3,5-epimerase [Pseudomonas oryzae]